MQLFFTNLIFLAVLHKYFVGKKNILPNLTNSQEQEPQGAACFWPLGSQSCLKKNTIKPKPEPFGEILGSRSRLEKQSGAGAI